MEVNGDGGRGEGDLGERGKGVGGWRMAGSGWRLGAISEELLGFCVRFSNLLVATFSFLCQPLTAIP
jgi:hypothetical protein